ncbi:MAG: outer membrane protein assembly factor BamA [Verrucomicrobiota bacterium]
MTKLLSRFCWLGSLLFSVSTLVAQTSLTVSKIEIAHKGPASVSDELIRANIRVKEGDPFQRASVDDDVRNLYATKLFNNIQVGEEITGDKIKLTYLVQGKLLLTEVKFSGNKKFSKRKLLKKVTSKVGQPMDDLKMFSDAQEIQKSYQKAGYQKTTVKPVPIPDESSGRATVTFEITETPKVRIQEIQFVGGNAFPQKKLRKVLKTKRKWMFSWLTGSAVLKDEQFDNDKAKLIEFYQGEGYIDFEIKDVQFDYITPTKLNIRFIVSEGTRYKVGDIKFKGNSLFPTNDIYKGIVVEGKTRKIEMTVGKIFTPKALRKDVEAIQDFYGAKGYIDTRVAAIKNANTTTGTMDLVYELIEGNKSFIEKIEIKGNDKTKDKVLRRELAVSPGEVYDMVRVKLSRERLEGLQYFEKVDTQSEETDVPNRKNLVIGVGEKNTGNFILGAGLSSVDSVVGFIEVSQENFDLFKPPTFTGAGQKFRLRAQVGTRRQDYQLTFIEPWFLGRKLAFGVDLYHRDLGYLSDLYDERHTGGSLSLTKALGSESLIGRVAYTLESIDVKIDKSRHVDTTYSTNTVTTPTNSVTTITTNKANISQDIYDEGGQRLISKFGSSIAYDTRNNHLLPERGQRTELFGEIAGGPLGGDTDFYKVELKSAWYFPGFLPGHILEIVGQSGFVKAYGNGDRGRDRVPIFDRWFLGGLYSLRGYKYRDVGPQDEFGEPLGGNSYWFGSAEYSIPIIERLRFAMFYDVGNVYSGAFSFDPKGRGFYNDNWGVGLRINIPLLGPLRLDYGFPLTHDKNLGGQGRFNFGVGFNTRF